MVAECGERDLTKIWKRTRTTKENIKVIIKVAKENFTGHQAMCIKETSKMTNDMVKVRCIGKMVVITKANGTKVCSMDRVKCQS